MLKGSCLCASVRYQVDGPLDDVRRSHGTVCRKAHGAAFRSRASVRARDLRWTDEENLISWCDSSPGTQRRFCNRCGSPLLSRFAARPDVYGLPLGCLGTHPEVRPAMNIHFGSKAPWFEITDSLARHDEGPPR